MCGGARIETPAIPFMFNRTVIKNLMNEVLARVMSAAVRNNQYVQWLKYNKCLFLVHLNS